jgi:hypothetical protein
MKCNCGSERILNANGKVSDMCDLQFQGRYKDGYVPSGLNIGSGDYLEVSFCLDCGKVQGNFPVTDEQVNAAFGD